MEETGAREKVRLAGYAKREARKDLDAAYEALEQAKTVYDESCGFLNAAVNELLAECEVEGY